MTTLPCAVYEDVLPSSQYVSCFFEAKKVLSQSELWYQTRCRD